MKLASAINFYFLPLCAARTHKAEMTSIPVVDFNDVLSCTDLSSCQQVEEIHAAFTTIGYIFVKNHGIDGKLVTQGYSIANKSVHVL